MELITFYAQSGGGTYNTQTKVNAILVAGLDNRSGDLDLSQQVERFKKGFGTSKTVKGFRYNTATKTITDFVEQNLGAYVVTFSAGCNKLSAISNVKGVDKNKLYAVEPWAKNGNSSVSDAVANGVPASNIIVGPSSETGKGVVKGTTPTPNRTDHWSALQSIGNLLK